MILEHTRFYGFQKINMELGENNTKSIWEIVHDHDHDVCLKWAGKYYFSIIIKINEIVCGLSADVFSRSMTFSNSTASLNIFTSSSSPNSHFLFFLLLRSKISSFLGHSELFFLLKFLNYYHHHWLLYGGYKV